VAQVAARRGLEHARSALLLIVQNVTKAVVELFELLTNLLSRLSPPMTFYTAGLKTVSDASNGVPDDG